ncbi:MAG TPA: carboxypeptidase-like regulatory domain-containing protein [Candidatus Solibacter sp.]|nr:carboxypeptidase-like regulatory domain-containing protein [Candidatus Solibacter sp.]
MLPAPRSQGRRCTRAQVHATNSATGVEVSAVTNESGNYALPYLLPGNYTVTAQAAGFKKSVRNAIELCINDRVDVDFELQIGQAAEAVDVHAETPLLDTAGSSLGQVVDQRRVLDLPTFGGCADGIRIERSPLNALGWSVNFIGNELEHWRYLASC